MDRQLKSHKPGLKLVELGIIMAVISGILIFTLLAVLVFLIIPKFASAFNDFGPKFTAIFNDLGVELPLSTRILIGTTDTFQTYWWVALTIFVVGAVVLRQYLLLETSQVWLNRLRHELSLKHLIIFIALFVVLVAVIIGFTAVAMILPIFKANQLLTG